MHEHNESADARVVVNKRMTFNCIAAAMMMVFFCVTTFGQSMYVGTYSDIWGDVGYVYACGVTDAYDWSHNARVITRVTAPNGGYSEFDTGEQSDFARADVNMTQDLVGEFLVQSDHWQWCPTAFQLEFAGSTLASLFFGPWSEKWYKTTDREVFPNSGDCVYHSDCGGQGDSNPPCPGHSAAITAPCTNKYIKEAITMISELPVGEEQCNILTRRREFWATKFGTCGRKP